MNLQKADMGSICGKFMASARRKEYFKSGKKCGPGLKKGGRAQHGAREVPCLTILHPAAEFWIYFVRYASTREAFTYND